MIALLHVDFINRVDSHSHVFGENGGLERNVLRNLMDAFGRKGYEIRLKTVYVHAENMFFPALLGVTGFAVDTFSARNIRVDNHSVALLEKTVVRVGFADYSSSVSARNDRRAVSAFISLYIPARNRKLFDFHSHERRRRNLSAFSLVSFNPFGTGYPPSLHTVIS